MDWIYYIPLATFTVSVVFSFILFKHYLQKTSATYILWWFIGVLTYGAGTLTESINTVIGWSELNFRWWYITGALLGGAPLAQGTVYLILKKSHAHILTSLLVITVLIASYFVLKSPINFDLVEKERMSGSVFQWQWVRRYSPFINIYAVLFLVGGAIYSALKYWKSNGSSKRFWGNLLIAIGAILPGIGGSFTRFGYVEVLYVTEFTGLVMIIWAYSIMKTDQSITVHDAQKADSSTTSSND